MAGSDKVIMLALATALQMREIETRRISLAPEVITTLSPSKHHRPLYYWNNGGLGTDIIVWSEIEGSITVTHALACSPALARNIKIMYDDKGRTLVCHQQHFTHISLGNIEQGTLGYPTRLIDQQGLEIDPRNKFHDRRNMRPAFADPIFDNGAHSLALATLTFDSSKSQFMLAKVVGFYGTPYMADQSLVDALLPSTGS